jgi:hypothetical protein
MKEYKFKNQFQIESEQKKLKVLKEAKEQMKGKKLLKEATFTVTTIDDAILTIQECMKLIAFKKRNPLTFLDLISSAIVSGVNVLTQEFSRTDDEEKMAVISDKFKKRIIMTIRSSLGM